MEALAKKDYMSPYVTLSVQSQRAQHLADQIVLDLDTDVCELTAVQEALIMKTERLIKRLGGTYRKLIETLDSDIAYGFEPMVLMIPTQNKLQIRCLSLLSAFDETIIAIDSAWLNRKISTGQRGKAIRQLEGRVYRAIEQLNCQEHLNAE